LLDLLPRGRPPCRPSPTSTINNSKEAVFFGRKGPCRVTDMPHRARRILDGIR
jgi:hypothetical protein